MPEAFIVSAKRTPGGRRNGRLAGIHPADLGATILDAIIAETAVTQITERGATRMDDQTSEASMEKRKKEGYF